MQAYGRPVAFGNIPNERSSWLYHASRGAVGGNRVTEDPYKILLLIEFISESLRIHREKSSSTCSKCGYTVTTRYVVWRCWFDGYLTVDQTMLDSFPFFGINGLTTKSESSVVEYVTVVNIFRF